MDYYKVFTHDLRSPLQGGLPVWDGHLPFELPSVKVDNGPEECAAGWNAASDPATALRIAGLWPDGYPSRLFKLEPITKVLVRREKCRASTWRVVQEITDLRPAIESLSAPFAPHVERMVKEQMAWREALARPFRSEAHVIEGLQKALEHRGLSWKLLQFPNARAARTARDAWASWVPWDAWDARDAWASWDSKTARAARAPWAARDAWDAWAALFTCFISLLGKIQRPPDFLSVGLRDAYKNGLAITLPVAKDTLGWAMVANG